MYTVLSARICICRVLTYVRYIIITINHHICYLVTCNGCHEKFNLVSYIYPISPHRRDYLL